MRYNKKIMPKLCLWIDSTDFGHEKKEGESTQDPDWSYKCNKPGGRYMLLIDGKSRVRKMWAGYEPKLWDGGFVKVMKDWFTEFLSGAGVLGDGHFAWASDHVPSIEWYTPKKEGGQMNMEIEAPSEKS